MIKTPLVHWCSWVQTTGVPVQAGTYDWCTGTEIMINTRLVSAAVAAW